MELDIDTFLETEQKSLTALYPKVCLRIEATLRIAEATVAVTLRSTGGFNREQLPTAEAGTHSHSHTLSQQPYNAVCPQSAMPD
ncbi:hypothetical protein Vi05172_g7313 [Venturia inaequalis]|nr:hypothetical protein Vi05172_g7313 [Venturia inaequalis]